MRYFIIGFKNSGKTTFGRRLANLLAMNFIDLDDYIEKKEGKTIPELFTDEGEEAFRKMEWEALKEVVRLDGIVVSTGGGVPCHCDNMSLMERYGEVIYLKVLDETLVSRLKKASAHRPIVRGKSEEELRLYVAELKEKCEHHYLRAHHIIDGENLDMDGFVNSLCSNT
jgi:shikimate kinase